MMSPRLRSSIGPSAAWVSRTVERHRTRTSESQTFTSPAAKSFATMNPALFTSMSTGARRTRSSTFASCASSDRSATSTSTFVPCAAFRSAAMASSRSFRRATSTRS